MLPQDPAILLSYVNTCMRDEGCSLEEFCQEHDADQEKLEQKLAQLGCCYDPEHRRFG
ncbi:DUF4250 domain-containing protein [Pseudoflavonifractor sp. AF19-9AC]|uniref:DUF4250 domain-containing protein n=1 Tax=Pseudoflavonifractor sp. AF19-9AC TaxID=2292244 RepID=UPI000E4AC239|nr:DUF4250 domain-containing protein [Pseudoflavonifractor sp. AF19-9AC]RHR05642.1 DUF4250 domain-containing protein [Pseudoflavonifractor sp. AF19-9AC]